jgi:NADH-quinone oxidoreductase subunit J
MAGTVQQVAFFSLSILSILAAIGVVSGRNMFRTIVYFAGFLLAVAGLFFTLESNFVAVTQIFIYVGGIVVMILFAIMLTTDIGERSTIQTNEQVGISALVALAFAGVLVFSLNDILWPPASDLAVKAPVEKLGQLFLSDYLLPFEVISVVLVVALIGAIIIAREEETR